MIAETVPYLEQLERINEVKKQRNQLIEAQQS